MFLFDIVAPLTVAEAKTDYSKRRQRERDVDAGKPVSRQAKNPQTDYAKKRARDKKEMELGEQDPCWKDYKQVGMKTKGGKQVPNCVPKESSNDFMANDSTSPIGGNSQFEDAWHDGDNAWSSDNHEMVEFAPSPEREDDEVPDQILKLANRWWNAGDKQPQITNVLRSLGWSIAQVESEDDAVQMMHNDGTTYFISADDFDPEVFEGFQDFNKVEPYEVCLAGKPIKKFDYYEDARRFHDNWKKKLYREGNKAKADKITLMPLNLEEAMNKNDLLGNVAKDLNTQFKKAKSGKLKASGDFTRGDHWQGAKPGDYGYTGYQGHGMPTDREERARIRADKKKGVAEVQLDEISRRDFLKGAGAAVGAAALGAFPLGSKAQSPDYTQLANYAVQQANNIVTNYASVMSAQRRSYFSNYTREEVYKQTVWYLNNTSGYNGEQAINFSLSRAKDECDNISSGLGDFIGGGGLRDNVAMKVVNTFVQTYTSAIGQKYQEYRQQVGQQQQQQKITGELSKEDFDTVAEGLILYAICKEEKAENTKMFKDVSAALSRVMKAYNNKDQINSLYPQVKKSIEATKSAGAYEKEMNRSARLAVQTIDKLNRIAAGKEPEFKEAANPAQQAAIAIAKKKEQGVAEGTNYWTKLQNDRNTKLNSLVNELNESIKK